MNHFHENKMPLARSGQVRTGLSIIEVLTSVVVAMIGVFGVMILIPFAVKQAQTGLDSDAAVMLGRNADSRFAIEGYTNPTNWAVYRGPNAPEVTVCSPYAATDTDNDGVVDGRDLAEVLSIDPLGITENVSVATPFPYNAAAFPFKMVQGPGWTPFPVSPPALVTYRIRAVNLVTHDGGFMTTPTARRMFRSADDLIFGEAVDELLGPEQYIDSGGGVALRRQSAGRLSWSAIVVPFKPDGTTNDTRRWSYKMYILVYKDRNTNLADLDGSMVTAMLEPTQNVGVHSPVTNVYFEPGVYVEPTVAAEGVVRDDWVMLINRSRNTTDDPTPPPGVTYAEKGFDRQIAFYRVVNVSNGIGAPAASNTSTLSSMTLDGPDFNFGTPAVTTPNSVIRETFAIHLKDVVGVYERTFEPENESTWN